MYHLGWLRYQCFVASTDPKECIPAMMALGDDTNEKGLHSKRVQVAHSSKIPHTKSTYVHFKRPLFEMIGRANQNPVEMIKHLINLVSLFPIRVRVNGCIT